MPPRYTELKRQFVKSNIGLCNEAFRQYLEGSGRNTKEGLRMVILARDAVGYSARTVDIDIFMSLFRTWKAEVAHA